MLGVVRPDGGANVEKAAALVRQARRARGKPRRIHHARAIGKFDVQTEGGRPVNHGYQPKTSDISTKLYWTFFFGIILGTAFGWGLHGVINGGGDTPDGTKVAQSDGIEPAVSRSDAAADGTPDRGASPEAETAPAVVESPADGDTPDDAAEKTAEQTPAPDAEPSVMPFDPDVEGLWPARHIFVGLEGTKLSVDTVAWLSEFKPGGVLLEPRNVEAPLQLGSLILQIKRAVGLGTTISDPPVILYRDSARPIPAVAPAGELADSSEGAVALAQARAARSHGIGVFIAPSLDLYLSGTSATAFQAASLGGTPDVVSERGLRHIEQFRAGGILPVAAHFPGAGLAVRQGPGDWVIPASEMDGLAAGMQPFQNAIDARVPGLLVGHMAIPGIEPENPGRRASGSAKLLKNLLRQRMGFNGVIVADNIGVAADRANEPVERIAVESLASGCDAVILRDASRESLLDICRALTRLSQRDDFPTGQLKASQARLDDWLALLAAPPAQPAPEEETPVVVAANTPAEDTPEEDGRGAAAPESETETLPDTSPGEGSAEAPEPAGEAGSEEDTEAMKKADPSEEAEPDEANNTDGPDPKVKSDEVAEDGSEEEAESTTPADDVEFLEHRIEKGDTLIELAKRYDVTVAQLNEWNNLESQTIKYGFKLKVRPLETTADGTDGESTEEAPSGDESDVDESDEEIETPTPEEKTPAEETAEDVAEVSDGATNNAPADGTDSATEQPAEATGGDAHMPKESGAEIPAAEGAETSGPVADNGDTPAPAPSKDTTPGETADEPASEEGVDAEMAGNAASGAATNEEESDVPDGETAPEDTPATSGDDLTGSDPEEEAAPSGEGDNESPAKLPQPPNTDKRTHKVAEGDTVGSIADMFGVGATDLVAWNGLEGEDASLEPGATLVAYLPLAAPGGDDAPSTDPDAYEIHVVKPGDNLRRIALQYGVSQDDLIKLNDITNPDHVQLGWKLKIPK